MFNILVSPSDQGSRAKSEGGKLPIPSHSYASFTLDPRSIGVGLALLCHNGSGLKGVSARGSGAYLISRLAGDQSSNAHALL